MTSHVLSVKCESVFCGELYMVTSWSVKCESWWCHVVVCRRCPASVKIVSSRIASCCVDLTV